MSKFNVKKYRLSDYDQMEIKDSIIYTNNFTENMEQFEEIDEKHPFMIYLLGFTHNLLDINIKNIHGWFHKETKKAKFFAGHPYDSDSLIYIAWSKYCKGLERMEGIYKDRENIEISIYRAYCGSLYESNEYEKSEKMFYAMMANKIITHITSIQQE